MKKIIALMVFAAVATVGCKEGEKEIAPSMISNLVATPGEGSITLSWTNPTGGDYYYSRIEYTDPVDGKKKVKNASNLVNSLTIKGLFRKNGDYTFKVWPVSSTHTLGSEYLEATSRSLAVPPTYTEDAEGVITRIPLEASQLAVGPTSAVQDPNEGSLAGLVDEDPSTFWHENWHSKQPYPQYWTIKLGKEVRGVKLKLITRVSPSNHAIKEAEIFGSNDDDSVSDEDATWTSILSKDRIGTFPTGNAAEYTTPTAQMPNTNDKFRRVKLQVYSVAASYWVYSKLEVHEVPYKMFDPEL